MESRPVWRNWGALKPLAAQMGKFGLVGGVQLIVDWVLFVALTWLGVGIVPSNLVSRAGAATLGFWLNGKYTFAEAGDRGRLGAGQMIRFLVIWIVMSALSSAVVWWVGHKAGLGWAWLIKPAADAAFALLSFFISKHWIYR